MLKLKKRQGASSVLILFTVVILVTLGLFTIVSASVNYSQSQKSALWTRSYYELDSYGEALLANVDNALFQAEQEAVNYIMTSEYLQNNAETIPSEIHEINKDIYNNDKNNVYKVLNNTYKSLAINYLKPLEDTYDSNVVAIYNEDGSVYSLFYTAVLTKYDDLEFKFDIKINIQDILYDINVQDGVISGKKIDFKKRYLVTKWQQIYEWKRAIKTH